MQAYRMNGDAIWLTRAGDLRAIGLRHFMDESSGNIAEFITPKLQPLPAPDGQRREIGHQCEWAWLLMEEARLSLQPELITPATRLITFADTYGFAQDGPLNGAVFDSVSADGTVLEHSILLWPQTEAIKILAVRHAAGDPDAGERARALLCLMFERWFADTPFHANQMDADGGTIWPQTLTRLMYHIVFAMTEGAKAGLWPNAPQKSE